MNKTKNATITIPLRQQEEYYGPPSRTCAICGANELNNARIGTTEFWLCPDCLYKIRMLIDARTDEVSE